MPGFFSMSSGSGLDGKDEFRDKPANYHGQQQDEVES
jgi:hypothetical protein